MSLCLQCENEALPGGWLCRECRDPISPPPETPHNFNSGRVIPCWPSGSIEYSEISDPANYTPEKAMNSVTNINPDDRGETIESTWNANTEEELRVFGNLVQDAAKKRKAINASVAAGKAGLIDRGFPASAIQAALAYHNTSDDERQNWDTAYMFTRKSLGCPIQQDMFNLAMSAEVTVEHKPSDKPTTQ